MTNGGLLTTNQQGNLRNYVNLWCQTKAISNITSLIRVKNKNRIICESDNGDSFIVTNTRLEGQ